MIERLNDKIPDIEVGSLVRIKVNLLHDYDKKIAERAVYRVIRIGSVTEGGSDLYWITPIAPEEMSDKRKRDFASIPLENVDNYPGFDDVYAMNRQELTLLDS